MSGQRTTSPILPLLPSCLAVQMDQKSRASRMISLLLFYPGNTEGLFYFIFLRGNLLAQAACTKGVCLLCSSSWALPTPSDRVRVVHWRWHGIFPASVQEGHLLATPLTGLPLPRLFYCGSLQPEQLPRTLAGHPYCGRKGGIIIHLCISTERCVISCALWQLRQGVGFQLEQAKGCFFLWRD